MNVPFPPPLQMPRIGPVQMGAIGILLLATLLRTHSSHACKISEFPCRGGALCLPLDKYCDGRDDCGDASDEPKYCTGNSIYYINPRPVPYILHLRWRMRCTRDHTRLRIIVGLCMEMRRPTDRPDHPPPATANISPTIASHYIWALSNCS